jgi:5-formyltetrahydrofolate cyclo-ligase
MHVSDQKAALRASIKERLERLPEQKRIAESRSICRRVLENLPPAPCVVCAYVPLKSEADIRPLLEALLKRGDRLFLPRFEENELRFRRADDLSKLLPGALKIQEPPESAELLDPHALQIALIPGRAFDLRGGRLGRGNGGFDIWVEKVRAANKKAQFWGIALELQIVNDVPKEPHDQPLDAIVTARGKIEARH